MLTFQSVLAHCHLVTNNPTYGIYLVLMQRGLQEEREIV